MDIGTFFIFVISGYIFPETLAHTSVLANLAQYSHLPSSQRQNIRTEFGAHRRINPAWVKKYCGEVAAPAPDNGVYPWLKNKLFKRASDGDDGGDAGEGGASSSSADTSSSGTGGGTMTTLKGLLKRVPQINFYSSIPNAVGVVGQGLSVLEKISIALGTPLPYFIGSPPLVLFGIALVFMPDLTTLNLPGFYPSGAGENDPLAAFPPMLDLDGLPDVDLSLNADNIPPRIIPAGADTNSSSQAPPLSSQVSIASEDAGQAPQDANLDRPAFDPTDPISFDVPPRRRVEGQSFSQSHAPYMLPSPLQPKFQQFDNNNFNRYTIHRPT